jgi:hypothetical protein
MATLLIVVGCSKYDDSELTGRVDNLENRVTALEELCKQMNTNITSLQTIVNALQNNDYVTSVTPIMQDGVEIGYTITFAKSDSITIYHGKNGSNGEDGYTPVIGVEKDTDGIYYWTIDGEWLTDDKGNKIKAQGIDGKDGQSGTNGEDGTDGNDGTDGSDGTNGKNGKDGITPKLKIENDYWYVSYNNGKSWEKLDKATGEDGKNGDSMFSGVTQDADNVYFQLSNGTTITIPKSNKTTSIELTYIPRYNDGKATVFYTKAEDSYVEFDFEVSPISAVADWENISTIKAVYTQTRAEVNFVDMDILEWATNKAKGIITIKASGKNLSKDFFAGKQDASARLVVSSDDINIISDYIPMVAKQTVKLTDYALTAAFSVTNGKCVFPSADGIAGESNPYVIVDYGDGTYGTDSKHTYAKDGDYTVKFYFEKPITEIAQFAFHLLNIKSIFIPKDVAKIGSYAFHQSDLESITFENDSKLTHIEDGAFMKSKIAEITLPASITNMGLGVFAGCKDLKNINSYSQTYHSWHFHGYGCNTLERVVNNIGNIVAYAGASRLERLLVSTTGTIIKMYSFTECKYLKEISMQIEKIESYNFNYGCVALESVGMRLTASIGEGVLNNCPKLQKIDAPVAAEIGANTFCQNESMTEISLGCADLKTLDTIGNENASLQIIRIPSGVTSISNSFNKCAAVAEIYCSAATPPTLTDSFDSIPATAKIYVPKDSVDDYKAANGWKDHQDKICEMP